MTAMIYRADGTSEVYEGGDTLEEWQAAIGGGYLEAVYLDDNVMFVDEDGLMKQLPFNSQASVLAQRDIVGDVLFMDRIRAIGEPEL
jgi:hypothetical protein